MGGLIRVEEKESNFFPFAINALALGISSISLITSLSFLQQNRLPFAGLTAAGTFLCSAIADFVNRSTKSDVAIAQVVSDAEARLTARLIEAQEATQATDLLVSNDYKLSKLDVDSAAIKTETAIHLADLEARYRDAIARLQEWGPTDET